LTGVVRVKEWHYLNTHLNCPLLLNLNTLMRLHFHLLRVCNPITIKRDMSKNRRWCVTSDLSLGGWLLVKGLHLHEHGDLCN
jgi:hypothetical protein